MDEFKSRRMSFDIEINKQKINYLSKKNNSVESKLNEQNSKISDLESVQTAQTQTIEEIQTIVSSSTQKISEIEGNLQQNGEQLESLQQTVDSHSQTLLENAQALSSHNQSISSLTSADSAMAQTISSHTELLGQHTSAISTLEGQISNLSSSDPTPSNPQSSGGCECEQTEHLMSYDYFTKRDNTYRNDRWIPASICFLADVGTKVRMRLWFTLKNTYAVGTTVNATILIKLDGQTLLEEVHAFEDQTPYDVDITHNMTSTTRGHKVDVTVINDVAVQDIANCIKADFISMEIYGTNVQFTSRTYDFMTYPTDTHIVMTNTCIGECGYYSMQPADQNLSLDPSNFTQFRNNNRRKLNQIVPCAIITFESSAAPTGTFSQYPTIFCAGFPINKSVPYITYSNNISTTGIVPGYNSSPTSILTRPTIQNYNNTPSTFNMHLNFLTTNKVVLSGGLAVEYEQIAAGNEVHVDACGVLRINNLKNDHDILAILTRLDGTSFLINCKRVSAGNWHPEKIELGFGTHPNAYVNQDEQIDAYLRIGQDVKHIVMRINPQTNKYEEVSHEILKGIQEYWVGPNNCHFERKGNIISYFPNGATEPSSTLEVYC